jgi:hypothetical protein
MPSRDESADSAGSRARTPVRVAQSTAPARALALQRLVGNRATASQLARWAAHPDPEKKGVIVPDVVAADFLRFNPPKNG